MRVYIVRTRCNVELEWILPSSHYMDAPRTDTPMQPSHIKGDTMMHSFFFEVLSYEEWTFTIPGGAWIMASIIEHTGVFLIFNSLLCVFASICFYMLNDWADSSLFLCYFPPFRQSYPLYCAFVIIYLFYFSLFN